jgi:hypothetical protein
MPALFTSDLKMEIIGSSEIVVSTYKTTKCHNTGDHNVNTSFSLYITMVTYTPQKPNPRHLRCRADYSDPLKPRFEALYRRLCGTEVVIAVSQTIP